MNKFTEGEWLKTEKGTDGDIYIYHPDHGTVAVVTEDLTNQEGNAQLISASPDLLEASKDAHECITGLEAYKNGYQWAVSAAAKLNRAIKKAEG